ncbi:hypothetical protein L6452_20396 [Arctium lappa]|uniref:Uncharacterized protein n=1 Tax=Arctium lappa TaxID=4217 RepID=A0ACB9BB84_ARCLA|nr:hypothetical protein L6452_20396 [Arctium lappa]
MKGEYVGDTLPFEIFYEDIRLFSRLVKGVTGDERLLSQWNIGGCGLRVGNDIGNANKRVALLRLKRNGKGKAREEGGTRLEGRREGRMVCGDRRVG